jgi:hypothetical protein
MVPYEIDTENRQPSTLIRRASTSMTCAERMEPATSMASDSWVNSSTTVWHLICCPLPQALTTEA